MFTSDHALKLDWLPDWVAIIGSGYIGLEFSDVYTALGCDVTFVEVCIQPAIFRGVNGFAEDKACMLSRHGQVRSSLAVMCLDSCWSSATSHAITAARSANVLCC